MSHTYTESGFYTPKAKVFCGDCETPIDEDLVALIIVELERLTVAEGATQDNVEGEKNWAAPRAFGDAVVEAVLSPDVAGAADLISWSAGTPGTTNKTRRISKESSARIPVEARVGTSSDEIVLWVLAASLEYRLGSGETPSAGNDKSFPSNRPQVLGPLTDEDDGITFAEATGHIEIVATLKPPGVNEVVRSGWEIRRWKTIVTCVNGTRVFEEGDDTSDPAFTDLIPDTDERIYDLDRPTIGAGLSVIHTQERYLSFYQWVEWNGDRSLSGIRNWHFRAVVDDDLDPGNRPRNDDTLLLDFGEGSIVVPDQCRFEPR